ncbi:MAG: lipocalin family protein [Alistipes sp.]|nr:lipocalin family protein [Alistipes sp.]
MKNLKIWSLAVAILMVVTGCGETTSTGDTFKPGDVSKIVNEWQLIEWGGAEAQFDVYIKFDGANVVLYQRFAADYEKYEGTYTLNGKVLSGKYTDGKDFGPYDAEVSADGKTLRLHKDDVMGVYAATTIPAWVKDFAVVGGANENEGTEGDGTEGDGTEGDGTEGDGTEGDGTEGDGTEGDGTEGDGTEGDGTEGEGTEGGDTTEGGEEQNPAPGTTACRFVGVPFL